MGAVHEVARRVDAKTKKTASNPGLEFLERLGYVVRGVLYAVMGILALGLAVGTRGTATDPSGSLRVLTILPGGRAMLIVAIVGLIAYSIWGFVRAIFDPLHRGDDPMGIAERLGFVWSGTAYASIALFGLHLFVGNTGSSHDSTQEAIGKILATPAGQPIAIAIGIVAIGVGLGQFVDAYRAVFKKDLKRVRMKKAEKVIVDTLGRLGMVSRGVTFTLVGWFVLEGGWNRDASKVHGYGGAFLALLAAPFGRALLALVAVGFIALGLHSFACARWIRLLSTR